MSRVQAKQRGPLKRIPLKGQARPRRSGAEGSTPGPPRTNELARAQFARTFADILSRRYGGRWSVEWKDADDSALAANRDGRPLAGEE